MVAGAGATINPQCFLGPQGPVGPPGPALIFSTLSIKNGSVLYYDTTIGITGNSLFTFSSTINSQGQVTIEGDLVAGTLQTNYTQFIQQPSIPLISSGIVWYNQNTHSLFVDSQDYSPITSLKSSIIGLGSTGYISSLSLISTVKGIDLNLQSSIIGLGSSAYISSLSLISTVKGIDSNIQNIFVSSQSGNNSTLRINFISSVKGLGSSGYISSLSNVRVVSSLAGYFGAGFISSLSSSKITTGIIFAQSISTTTVFMQNNLDSNYQSIKVLNSQLALKGNTLAYDNSVNNTMFSLLYSNVNITVPNSNPLGTYESDTNTFNVTAANPITGSIVSGESFQSVTASCIFQTTNRQTSSSSYGTIFGFMASCNYDSAGFYNTNVPFMFVNTSNIYLNFYTYVDNPFTIPLSPIYSREYQTLYNSNDIVTMNIEYLQSNSFIGIVGSNYFRYSLHINGQGVYSNVRTYSCNASGVIPANLMPHFSLMFSNLYNGDVFQNILFSGVNKAIPTNANIANLITSPGVLSNNFLNGVSTLIDSYGYISTASMNNAMFTLEWPPLLFGELNFNPVTNCIYSGNQNVIFQGTYIPQIIYSKESYQNVFFSCVAKLIPSEQQDFGIADNNFILRYYFSYNAGTDNITANVFFPGFSQQSYDIKSWNSNDVLAISVKTIYSFPSYTLYASFYINGNIVFPYNIQGFFTSRPPYMHAGFTPLRANNSFSNIVFTGSYEFSSTTNSGIAGSYPLIFSPTYSTINLIDTVNEYNVLTLSNHQSTLYFNGCNLTSSEPFVSSVKGLGGSGYISSLSLDSTIKGLGSYAYLSTASLNNGLFSLIIPTSVEGNFQTNSSQNRLSCTANDTSTHIRSGEQYDNAFFSCKANIANNDGSTKFGLLNTFNDTVEYYFYKSGGLLNIYYKDDSQPIKSWNSNDILSISLTRATSNSDIWNFVSYFVNGVKKTTVSKIGFLSNIYTAGFKYFNQGDTYSDIIFSGSYNSVSTPITSVFPTCYPYNLSPTYSTINLIDTYNEYNILPLSNFQSTLYFNGSNLGGGGGGGIENYQLVSTVQGLGSSQYISSFDLASTVQGLGSSQYISSFDLASTVQGLGSSQYLSSFDLVSTVEGLGSLGYTSSLENNGLFTIVTPNDAADGTFVFNPITNTLYATNVYNNCNIVSLESYNNVFFSCVPSVIGSSYGDTKFGLVDNGGNFLNYFTYINSTDLYYYVNGNQNSAGLWNSNNVLSISITNQGPTQVIKFYVNGSLLGTPTQLTSSYNFYRACFNYFTSGDTYKNIVFSGSYGIIHSNYGTFPTSYPFIQNPPTLQVQWYSFT